MALTAMGNDTIINREDQSMKWITLCKSTG